MLKEKHIGGYSLFFLLFIVSMFFQDISSTSEYFYDALYYFENADKVFENGFDFLNYGPTYRGYFYPMLIGVFKRAFFGINSYEGIRILFSFLISLTFCYALPQLLERNNKFNIFGCLRIIMAWLIFLLVWGDFSLYPLSDLPAAFFMIMGIAYLSKTRNENRKPFLFIYAFAAGLFFYAAYNTRVAYFYGIIFALVVMLVYLWGDKKRLGLSFVALILGMCIIACPQSILNREYFGDYSPRVHTEYLYGGDHNLQAQQVFWGLTMDRYETYVGDYDAYPHASVVFNDPVGNKIVDNEGIVIENFSIFDVFRLFLKYPLDIMSVYVRHLVSLLTPAFPQLYITAFHIERGFLATVSIMIWLIIGIYIWNKKQKLDSEVLLDVLAVCIPCLLQAIGATELRFFLPIYLIGYYIVFKCIDYKELFESLKGKWLKVVACIVIIYLLWITVYGDVLANVNDDVLLIDDNYYNQVDSQ